MKIKNTGEKKKDTKPVVIMRLRELTKKSKRSHGDCWFTRISDGQHQQMNERKTVRKKINK